MPGQDLLHDPEAMAQFWSLLNGQPVSPELVAEAHDGGGVQEDKPLGPGLECDLGRPHWILGSLLKRE
jgi:hypothetical protein